MVVFGNNILTNKFTTMKRLFLLLALVGVLGISCSDKEETTPNQPQTPTEQPEDNSGSENESPENDDDQVTNIPNNEIWYTTSDNTKLFPNSIAPTLFGAILISNIYKDGQGVLTFDDDITVIGRSVFDGCTSLTSITIPNSVTTIGDCAFRLCNSLTSITIPDSVITIGDYAFRLCNGLTSITIPDSVITIGDYAFQPCSSLTSITIPDSVTTIGELAFYGCSSLTSVYCKATTPPAGDSDMFSDNASGRKIYVPMESVEAYKSAEYWSSYADAIEGYNF